jgi:sulfide:quinone oxidoreductase
MSRVVIVGAGFGGLGCAHTLANAVAKDATKSVVVIDAKDWFTIGGTWAYAWCGRVDASQTTWPLKDAAPQLPNVDLRLNTTVLSVDIEKKTVTLSDAPETPMPYDALVLSPGIVGDASGIPGLRECVDMYAHDHLERQRRDIERIIEEAKEVLKDDASRDESSGAVKAEKKRTLAVTIAATPYKCPVAPFEAAFVADDTFRKAGVREAVRVVVTAPVPWPLPDPARDVFEAYLAEKDVEFRPSAKIASARFCASESSFTVAFHDGSAVENASAVWAVYPQTAPAFIKNAGLANASGFVPAEIGTNRVVTDKPHEPGSLFCIGDCAALSACGNKPHPKAGEFAWQMGEMVAHAIANTPGYEHSRLGACIAECGGGAGVLVAPDFTECVRDPLNGAPKVQVADKREGGEAYKVEWVGKYITRLFGVEARKFAPGPAA